MKKLELKESSNIKEAWYDPNSLSLRVSFHSGSTYIYSEVPTTVVQTWQMVSKEPKGSVGSSFIALIKKGGFKYQKQRNLEG